MADVINLGFLRRRGEWLTLAVSWLFLLVPSLVYATQEDAADYRRPHKLVVTWNDYYQLVQEELELIRAEVDSIFLDLGVDIEWKEDPSRVLKPEADDLIVFLLSEKPSEWMPGKNVMGAVSHGRRPVIRIFHKNVTRTLDLEPDRLHTDDSELRTVLLARALSRVLAHEIIHAVAPHHPHAPHGLMTAHLNQESLTADEIILDPGSMKAFLAALRDHRKQAAGAAP